MIINLVCDLSESDPVSYEMDMDTANHKFWNE